MFLDQAPVEPRGFIVEAIGVIVAILGPPDLIPHQKHWHSQRKHGDREEVFYLSIAQLLDGDIAGFAFHATIPAAVIVSAVGTVLSVCLIVLLVVGNEVIQS